MSNRAKEIAAIMATYEPGQVWEMRGKGNAHWTTCHEEPWWNWHENDYRRKPEPKTRPMRPNEWPPVGTPVRSKSGGRISTLSSKGDYDIYLPMIGELVIDRIADYEFSLDGEKTWLPFTVTEPA